jgi:uncharacterized protein involved in exopolysaccharide biosynthesis
VESPQTEPDELAQESPVDPATTLLVPLVRSRWLVLGVVLLGGAAGVAYGIVQANSYLSTAKLLVRYGAREEVSPDTALGSSSQPAAAQPRDLVNNELELLSVPQVYESVVREITAQRLLTAYDPTVDDDATTSGPLRLFHKFQGWWFRTSKPAQSRQLGHPIDDCPTCTSEMARGLMKELTLNPEPGTSVITIAFAAHDPALARDVVGAFLKAAEARHRQAFSSNATLEFLAERLDDSLNDVRKKETEFSEYKLSCQVFDYDNQRTQLMTQSQDLDKTAAENNATLAKLKGSLETAQALLAEQPEMVKELVDRPLVPNPEWQAMRTRIFTLQDQLAEIENRVGGTTAEREAARESLQKRIASTTEALKQQLEFVEQAPILRDVPNQRHQRLAQDIEDLKQQISGLEKSNGKVVEQLQSVRRKIVTTEECEPKYHYLESAAKNARANYDTFLKAHEHTTTLNLMDQVEFSSLRRIQDPTLPFEKEGPKRAKFLIIGLLLGAFVGGALAFGRSTVDPYVRSPADVERLFGLRVVGVLPRSRLPWRLRRRMRHAAL